MDGWTKDCGVAVSTSRIHVAAIALGVAWLTGCGGDGTPATYPVKGKVVYKGSQAPVTQGTVLFESLSEPKVQASGEIQADGTFELASDLGKPGTVAGEHRALILPPVLEPGQKPVVQQRYTSYATSNLKATVAPQRENVVALEVE
jgi:hypothetical protein